ncbi:uncharacterized protein LOC134137306 isoform X2 [Rhea pennata]|uniref:uncharacterized protein LOC134137306 isoform X2 n=1 Tax=Rhea pennata TaxID=8795 RepID=UPI002E26AE01
MALPPLHRCLQLNDENEQLLKKLKKLRIKNKELEKNLALFQEKLHLQQLMHDCVTSRDVQVQTDSYLWHKGGHNKDLNLESENVRLLQMYNNLQKRYIKEIKTNQEQSETIKNLTEAGNVGCGQETSGIFYNCGTTPRTVSARSRNAGTANECRNDRVSVLI